jgi:hypothetical protein
LEERRAVDPLPEFDLEAQYISVEPNSSFRLVGDDFDVINSLEHNFQ